MLRTRLDGILPDAWSQRLGESVAPALPSPMSVGVVLHDAVLKTSALESPSNMSTLGTGCVMSKKHVETRDPRSPLGHGNTSSER